MNTNYFFTKEIADKFNLKIPEVRTLGRIMKVKKIFQTYTWFKKDIEKVERLIR